MGEPDRANERAALVLLAHCVEPGDAIAGALLQQWGARQLLERLRSGRSNHPNEEGLRARLRATAGIDPEARCAQLGGRIITRVDREWPGQLADLGPSAPLALWVVGAGDVRLLALRSVAVVGARACTPYGEEIARSWAADLGSARWTVVSGAAFGIDAAAHRGALAANGSTIAVLAGGVDVAYPRAHASLLAAIADGGLVVSESPPGEEVRRHRFLSRNRIIAALSRATVVVEAAVRSGATATAHHASALNRPVLAVPGPVTSPASAGCHRMVKDGLAQLASEASDVVAALSLDEVPAPDLAREPRVSDRDSLPDREATVLDAVPARGVVSLDSLVVAAGLTPGQVLAATGTLVSIGWLAESGGGWRLARR